METKVKIEATTASPGPECELRMQDETQISTLEPMQESKPGDLERFDRLCCLGDELACQRLGGKHHRTNTRCWTYPKICYHCDLVTSVDSKAKLLYMTSFQNQLGARKASSSSMTTRSVSRKASSVNRESFGTNRRTRSQRADKLEEMAKPENSGSSMDSCSVGPRDNCYVASNMDIVNNPNLHIESSPGMLVDSIEEYMPAEIGSPGCPKKNEMYEGGSAGERYHRSRAPSPEVSACSGHDLDPLGSGEEGSVEGGTGPVRRDPRYELGFLMNSAR